MYDRQDIPYASPSSFLSISSQTNIMFVFSVDMCTAVNGKIRRFQKAIGIPASLKGKKYIEFKHEIISRSLYENTKKKIHLSRIC